MRLGVFCDSIRLLMYDDLLKIEGREDGPTSIILVGVHGDERCGVEALERVLPSLEIERGAVFFGYGNPRAIEVNKRSIDANLNRMFKGDEQLTQEERQSYEYQRAQFLKNYLSKANVLLDIHASSTQDSKPFIICESNAEKIVKYLPIKLIVSGLDKVEPGGTDYYMNSNGKIGICLECGYTKDPQATVVAKESILAFLRACGHISGDLKSTKQSYVRMYDLYKTKSKNFTLSSPFSDFEEVLKGQVIGIDGKNEVRVNKDSLILFARNRKQIGEEAFLLGEKRNSLV